MLCLAEGKFRRDATRDQSVGVEKTVEKQMERPSCNAIFCKVFLGCVDICTHVGRLGEMNGK